MAATAIPVTDSHIRIFDTTREREDQRKNFYRYTNLQAFYEGPADIDQSLGERRIDFSKSLDKIIALSGVTFGFTIIPGIIGLSIPGIIGLVAR